MLKLQINLRKVVKTLACYKNALYICYMMMREQQKQVTMTTARSIFGSLQAAYDRYDKTCATAYFSTIACHALHAGNEKIKSIADKALDGFATDKMLWCLSYYVKNNNIEL